MTHTEIRDKILHDHEFIRGGIDEIQSLVKDFEKGGAELGGELRELGVALFESFASHLVFEDAQLVPVLRAIPRRGEALATRLELEHREQRELLTYLIGRLSEEQRPTTLVARELESFVIYLREDMAHEESALLRECLLES
jgi:hemerythrin-like domain-containing protein